MDHLHETARYPITSQPSLITYHEIQENRSPSVAMDIIRNPNAYLRSRKAMASFTTCQRFKKTGRIWNRIITNIQRLDLASPALKERTKTSIQQKWDALLQKFRDIKDKIESTCEEAIQNDWEFFNDMDNFLRKDPSIVALITSDSLYRIKRKV
ncbi:15157_t:CDS:2 [Funneliformis mosseae]|uniref:15157_t:CDS:1 n=1 Tax=Funneliformis mosseae TaxID=27381 RepID=A0A9N9D4I0_FUNMO|nr:15157_t:CDS:2 [Funneliformis mosseae]